MLYFKSEFEQYSAERGSNGLIFMISHASIDIKCGHFCCLCDATIRQLARQVDSSCSDERMILIEAIRKRFVSEPGPLHFF